ncbi:MAG: hypothetical protein K0U74_17410 [Alphaproteobacteria bacterium]|nr:hypothetical protein [Alphaproteobacteria bacterium]
MEKQTSRPVEPIDIEVDARTFDYPSFVDWSAVVAGAVIAAALSGLLYGFGASIGLYATGPLASDNLSPGVVGMAAAIFVALSYIYASAMGAYFTGRMRPRISLIGDEVQFRDGANGLITWALSILVGVAVVSHVVVAGVAAASSTAGAVANNVGAIVEPVAASATERLTRMEFSQATVPEEEGGQAAPPTVTGKELTGQQTDRLTSIIGTGLATGEVTAEDRRYIRNVIASETGIPAQQVEKRVAKVLDAAEEKAVQSIKVVKNSTAFAGFWAAVVLLLSGLASWWAATLGGSHRDEAAGPSAAHPSTTD